MAEIKKIQIDNVLYDLQDVTSGYSQIEISNLVSSGIALGTIVLNGNSYIIHAPNSSIDSGGLEVSVAGTNLSLVNNT